MTNNDPDPGWASDPQGHREWQQRQSANPQHNRGRDALHLFEAASVGYLVYQHSKARQRDTGNFKVEALSNIVFSYDEGWTIPEAITWLKAHPEHYHEAGRELLAAQEYAPPPKHAPKSWWRRTFS